MKKITLNSEKAIEIVNKAVEEKTLKKIQLTGKVNNDILLIRLIAIINDVKYYSLLENEEFSIKNDILEAYKNYLEDIQDETQLKIVYSIFNNGEIPYFKICLM